MELNTTATKAALKHGIGDVTDTLKCLLRLVISCFLQGGHLHCSQPDHKFSSVRISEVSQGSWRHGPSLSLSSTLVSHEAWKEVSWKQQRFSSLVRICQIPIIVKKTFKEKEELDHWKQTHHTWSGPVHRKDTSAVQAPPKCKSNQFISIKAAVSDGADIQHFLRSPRQPGSATLINSYWSKEIKQQSR